MALMMYEVGTTLVQNPMGKENIPTINICCHQDDETLAPAISTPRGACHERGARGVSRLYLG